MIFNYQQISSDLLSSLPERSSEVMARRFGLKDGKRETLEQIGKDFGITRERVRQIQETGLSKLREDAGKYQAPLSFFSKTLKTTGDLRKEDALLSVLGANTQNHIFFFLYLAKEFERFADNKDFFSLWTINRDSLSLAQEVLNSFQAYLKEVNRPLLIKDCKLPGILELPSGALLSYLEVSKNVCQDTDGAWGLSQWPEINPRGARDKAYLVLKREKRPLHFSQISEKINETRFGSYPEKNVLVQTVHNELIRDPRFILVGRGFYALASWGYEPGTVVDVISRVLESDGPLDEGELVDRVLEKRIVKKSTVLQNLRNKNRFKEIPGNKYTLIS